LAHIDGKSLIQTKQLMIFREQNTWRAQGGAEQAHRDCRIADFGRSAGLQMLATPSGIAAALLFGSPFQIQAR
jgi:hypothetical protein